MGKPLKNARHERFAHAIASGKSIVDAYELAGYVRNDSNASALYTGNHRIKERVEELLERAARVACIDSALIMSMLLKNARDAMREGPGQRSAANKALELLGREAAGMFTEKHVVAGNLAIPLVFHMVEAPDEYARLPSGSAEDEDAEDPE